MQMCVIVSSCRITFAKVTDRTKWIKSGFVIWLWLRQSVSQILPLENSQSKYRCQVESSLGCQVSPILLSKSQQLLQVPLVSMMDID